MAEKPVVIDFETMPIGLRHEKRYPPLPVSVSIKLPEWRTPKFFSWGHKTGGNNCSFSDGRNAVKAAYKEVREGRPLLAFNAKFDLDVAFEHMGCPLPPWHLVHDPMYLIFLDDPHQTELGLKPSASRILGMDRAERDEVEAWVLDRKKQLELDFSEIVSEYEGIKPSTAGKFIAYAPGTVVGPYANGDVMRALKLHERKYKEVCIDRGMQAAYDRERRLMPILLRNEREGIRTDVARLAEDEPKYVKAQATCDAWLRKALKAPTLDFDKDADVAKAFVASEAIKQITYTPTGRVSVSKKNL
jgi:hypothetical protein